MLSNKKIEKKIEELKHQLENYIEWSEELPRTDNPLADGVLEGNFYPDHRFMMKQVSEKAYKIYKFNEFTQVFDSLMIWEV